MFIYNFVLLVAGNFSIFLKAVLASLDKLPSNYPEDEIEEKEQEERCERSKENSNGRSCNDQARIYELCNRNAIRYSRPESY